MECVPYQRLKYFFFGSSWLLKAGGLFLFGTAALNPVLLAGVNPKADIQTSKNEIQRTSYMWKGNLDSGNSQFKGNIPSDNLMMIAALASMSNLSAPASTACQESGCQVAATMASLQANCSYVSHIAHDELETRSVCSALNPDICVELNHEDGSTEANFTTGFGDNRSCNAKTCPGEWYTILGVWGVFSGGSLGTLDFYSVDCQVQYGNVSISQTGGNGPEIVADSFEVSKWAIDGAPTSFDQMLLPSNLEGAGLWWYSYIVVGSPYWLTTSRGGGTDATIQWDPMASMLLNYGNEPDPSVVAKKIEKNFDMSTLLAFARAPDSANLIVTTTERVQVWSYNPAVLAILFVPLLATFLGLTGRMKVGSDDEVVGYDPVEIARRGPVMRRRTDMSAEEDLLDYDSDGKDEMEVWSVRRGEEKRRAKFVVE